ncbi:MAG: hypothetical protein SFV54_16615 [Bryobacteraceae bacterium]|nr:hypothetical protein [Bryobacteraceae bacterium]
MLTILDVALRRVAERAKAGDVWPMAAASLCACTCVAIVINNTIPAARNGPAWWEIVSACGLFVTGVLTARSAGRFSPTTAAAKAALVGYLPEAVALLSWKAGLFRPLVTEVAGPNRLLESRLAFSRISFPTTPEPPLVLVPLGLALVIVHGFVIGYAGGLFGDAVRARRAGC